MEQSDLFSHSAVKQGITLHGFGELDYYPAWMKSARADQYLAQLCDEVLWQQPNITVFGQTRPIPRQQAWYGDPGATMVYSKASFEPIHWFPALSELRELIQRECCHRFNSVLVNLYRNGNDSVSWHADDEPELGENPVIASLSFGCSRKFSLRPKCSDLTAIKLDPVHLNLGHGDLLVMRGATQRYWHHAVLKQKKIVGSRINLTFRLIQTA